MTKTAKRILRRRGGQPGNQNAYKHGLFTARAMAERAWVRWIIRQSRAHLKVTRESDAFPLAGSEQWVQALPAALEGP